MKLFAFFSKISEKKNRNKKAREKNTNVNNKPQQMDLKRKEFFKSISVQKHRKKISCHVHTLKPFKTQNSNNNKKKCEYIH